MSTHMTPTREQRPGYLVIKPDGTYLTTAPTLGDARRTANEYAKDYGRYGWRFVRVAAEGTAEWLRTYYKNNPAIAQAKAEGVS